MEQILREPLDTVASVAAVRQYLAQQSSMPPLAPSLTMAQVDRDIEERVRARRQASFCAAPGELEACIETNNQLNETIAALLEKYGGTQ